MIDATPPDDEFSPAPARTLPHDRQAEQSVLGGIMLSKSALLDVVGNLHGRDFYDPRHELVFDAIETVAGRNQPVDQITVGDELVRTGRMVGELDHAYLFELTSAVPTAANAGYYADIVREKAVLRRLVEAGTRIVQAAYDSEGNAEDLADTARGELDDATSDVRTEVRSVGAVINDVVDAFDEDPVYMPTPWAAINGYIHGCKPGTMVIIAARPGSGKTIMALMLAAALAEHGNVAYSSLEMGDRDLVKRLIASKSSVHMGALTKHRLTPDDWRAVAAARSSIADLPLFIDDNPGASLAQIQAFARNTARKPGGLAALVVDHLGLIPTVDGRKSRAEVVGGLTRSLRETGRTLGVPVIVCAQLNRESEKKAGTARRLPGLTDLRESGNIEQDADVVLMLQRRLDKDGNETDELDVVIAKNRQGNTGKVSLLWEGKYARVTTMPWAPYSRLPNAADWRATQTPD